LTLANHGFCDETKVTEEYASINGIEIYYEIHGDGEPLLLLHGGMGWSGDLEFQIDYFSRTYKVIAPASRGHGRTTDGPPPLTYDLMADDMIKLLDHLGVDSSFVIGFSDGGNIGLILSHKYPDRIRKLVAVGSNFRPDGLTKEAITTTTDATSESWPKTADLYRKLNPYPNHWTEFFAKVKTLWLSSAILSQQQIQKIEVKTMVVVGDRDDIRIEHTIKLFESIPDAQLCVIPGASHFVLWEKPELVNGIIAGFLK
jgi:pimeloyl-ACP methyl ester carboxylesterase